MISTVASHQENSGFKLLVGSGLSAHRVNTSLCPLLLLSEKNKTLLIIKCGDRVKRENLRGFNFK